MKTNIYKISRFNFMNLLQDYKNKKIFNYQKIIKIGNIVLLTFIKQNTDKKKEKYKKKNNTTVNQIKCLVLSIQGKSYNTTIKILMKIKNIFLVKTFFLLDQNLQNIELIKPIKKTQRANLSFIESYCLNRNKKKLSRKHLNLINSLN